MIVKVFLGISVLLTAFGIAYAGDNRVTPYGDYCKWCGTYGTCRTAMTPEEADKAIEEYYQQKGYRVGGSYHKGRFIEVYIFKDDILVDKVLFDRKTGRLRSLY